MTTDPGPRTRQTVLPGLPTYPADHHQPLGRMTVGDETATGEIGTDTDVQLPGFADWDGHTASLPGLDPY